MKTRSTRRLRARAVAINQNSSEFDDYGPEPNMKLSHAFLVVLLLHVIAVGAFYAFNTMHPAKPPKPVVTAKSAGQQSSGGPLSSKGPNQPPDQQSSKQADPQQDPGNRPPSDSKPPVVAKTSTVSKPAQTSSDAAAKDMPAQESLKTHQGLLAEIKAAIMRATGVGSAAVATASAQEPVPQVTAPSNMSGDATAPGSSTTGSVPKTYTVKAGDTITKIASSLGVTILALEKANGLTGSAVLRIGETLKVPEKVVVQSSVPNQTIPVGGNVPQTPGGSVATGASASATAGTNAPVDTTGMAEYTVVKGDNPYKIAKKFKITPDELMKVNSITDPKKIQIGQKLKIPASSKKSSQKVPASQ